MLCLPNTFSYWLFFSSEWVTCGSGVLTGQVSAKTSKFDEEVVGRFLRKKLLEMIFEYCSSRCSYVDLRVGSRIVNLPNKVYKAWDIPQAFVAHWAMSIEFV